MQEKLPEPLTKEADGNLKGNMFKPTKAYKQIEAKQKDLVN